jgi:hypothetical protein
MSGLKLGAAATESLMLRKLLRYYNSPEIITECAVCGQMERLYTMARKGGERPVSLIGENCGAC